MRLGGELVRHAEWQASRNFVDFYPDVHSHDEVCLAFLRQAATPLILKGGDHLIHAFDEVAVDLVLQMSGKSPVQANDGIFYLKLLNLCSEFKCVH